MWQKLIGTVLAMVPGMALASECVPACVSGAVDYDRTFPNPVGPDFRVRFQAGTADAFGPEGLCIEIQFRAEDGDPLGPPVKVRLPATGIPVPPGAATYDADESEGCDPELLAGAGPRFADPDRRQRPRKAGRLRFSDWLFFGGPAPGADFSTSKVSYSMVVRSPDRESACEIRDAILADGFGAPVPTNPAVQVEIGEYSVTRLDAAGLQVLVQVAHPEPIRTLALDVNGFPHSTLDDAVVTGVNGWSIATLAIPFSDPNLEWDVVPGTYTNDYSVDYTVGNSANVLRSSGEIAFEVQ